MFRRHLLNPFLLSAFAAGCAQREETSSNAAGPPPGAMTANPAHPPAGAKWSVRVTDHGLLHDTVEDKQITAAAVEFNGQPCYGLVTPTVTTVLNPATFNAIGTIRAGKTATTFTPDVGPFSWPLWPGKTWDVWYSFTDFEYGRVWIASKATHRVDGIEDVTVPAGTFQTFRITSMSGIGTDDDWTRWSLGLLGIRANSTHWYAPRAKITVRSVSQRLGNHYRWTGRTTAELLTLPA